MKKLLAKLTEPFDLYQISGVRSYLMGIACLWVTIYHSKYLNPFNSILLKTTHLLGIVARVQAIGNCAVDLFFFLSGLGLYFSYTRLMENDAHPTKTFYIRRYRRILPAVLIVTFLTYGLIEVEDLANWFGYVFLYGFLTPNLERGNFWYFSFTMVLYLVFPLVYRAVRGKRGIWGMLAITLASVALCAVLSRVAERYFYMRGILMFCRIPVFVLGAFTGKLCLRHQKVPAWVPALSIPAAIGLIVALNDLPEISPPYLRFYEYCALVLCIALSHGWIFSIFRKRGFLSKMIMLLGSYSMEIYLLYESLYNHQPILFNYLEGTGMVYSVTVFAATLVLAVLLKMVAGQLVKGYDALSGGAGGEKTGVKQ